MALTEEQCEGLGIALNQATLVDVLVAVRTYNNLYLFFNRVNPRTLVYQPAYTDWSAPALALK
jgi:hypothetical protein